MQGIFKATERYHDVADRTMSHSDIWIIFLKIQVTKKGIFRELVPLDTI